MEISDPRYAHDQDMEDGLPSTSAKQKEEAEMLAKLDGEIEAQRAVSRQPGQLTAALEALLALEKTHRLAATISATKRLLVAIVSICFEQQKWDMLNEHLVLLSKRRSQLKQGIAAMVQEAMSYLEKLPNIDIKIELIKTLADISDGKIFLEVERARLTRQLAGIKEGQGKLDEACDVMQEVAVETYGALSKREKIHFILEQVRITLDTQDFVRAQILAKKVSPRTFAELIKQEEKNKDKNDKADYVNATDVNIETAEELRLTYYELMIRYYQHENDYLECCRCFLSIFEDDGVKADETKWAPVMKNVCWFLVLSPVDPMQQSLLASTSAEKKLSDLPNHKELLKQFSTAEIIRWSVFEATYGAEMGAEAAIFGGDVGAKRLEALKLRVIEHNILTMAKYYSRLTMSRMAELLDLSVDDAEDRLSEMVVKKKLFARIDRLEGTVRFTSEKKQANEMMDHWSGNIEKLLDKVEISCHLIHKEGMSHKVPITSA